jgi:hypothetical protein
VILSRSQDQDLTVEKDRGGGELTVARVSGRRRRGSGQKVDVAGALGVPGGDGD